MLLPAQHCTAEHDAVLLGGWFQRLEIAARAEISERGAIASCGIAGGIEGKMQNAARRLDRRERPRMHFAEYRSAQGVRRESRALAIADRHLSTHGSPVARDAIFDKRAEV